MSFRLRLLLSAVLFVAFLLLQAPGERGTGIATPRPPASSAVHEKSPADATCLTGSWGEAAGVAEGSFERLVSPPAVRMWRVRTELHFADGSPVSTSQGAGIRWRIRNEDALVASLEAVWITETLHARLGDRIEVLEGRLGNRVVTPRIRTFVVSRENELRLVGDLPPDGRIRVVDARSGRDLKRVFLVSGLDSTTPRLLPPLRWLTEPAASFHGAPSPVSLPANKRPASFWLGAEDHAWRRIEFGVASDEPIYALEPGAGLQLLVDPPLDPLTEYVARIERCGGESIVELPLTGQPTELSGLPVGPVRIEFVAQGHHGVEYTITKRQLELSAGATATFALDLRPLWMSDAMGRIEVFLNLEDERDAGSFELSAESLDTPEPRLYSAPVRSRGNTTGSGFLWDSGPRAAGRHRVSASSGKPSVVVQVERGRTTRVHLDVPALPRIRLWATDADNGKTVSPDLLLWRERNLNGAGVSKWRTPTFEIVEGGAVFAVDPVLIELAVRAAGYATGRVELDARQDWQEVLLDLEPISGGELLVRLTSEGHPVGAPHETWSSTVVSGATGNSILAQVRPSSTPEGEGQWPDGASATLLVKEQGLCSLTLGEVPGFETPLPKSVSVGNERTVVDVELSLIKR